MSKKINTLKRDADNSSSGSVVLSFESKWEEKLRSGQVKAVFRRRGPTKSEASGYVYAYVSLPVSAIIGRAKLTRCQKLGVSDALKLADKGKIDLKELRDYAHEAVDLSVYQLGEFEAFDQPLGFTALGNKFGFSPPQNFFFLSTKGKKALDELAGI